MMQELASITSAEHELTAFAQRLMRRKAELIESLQQMSAAPAIPQGLPASLPQGLQNAVLPRPPAPTFVSLQSIRMAMPHAEPTGQPGAAAPSHSWAKRPPAGPPPTGIPPTTRDGAPASPPSGGAAVLTSAGFDTQLTPQKPFPPAGAMLAVEQSPSQADTRGAEAKAEYGGGGAASGLDLLSAALARRRRSLHAEQEASGRERARAGPQVGETELQPPALAPPPFRSCGPSLYSASPRSRYG